MQVFVTGWQLEGKGSPAPVAEIPTMTAVPKIALSASRDIPFNKLVLSQANVRRIKAGISIEELAEDIARRTLLQSLTVRAVRDEGGNDTGMFEVPAGGRRYRALELLVKQKRLAKTAPIPCVVREGGIAEEDSLAENIQRAPLHPLDQFRAFLALREKGQSEEEIAAAFFVSVAVVKQRLRLASVSPKLLDIYAEDGITLDQLMAFTVSGDHERQEQIFERLTQSYSKEPHVIRRLLTESAVRASDKRARFIGIEGYVEAGGTVMRDLFHGDDGGWLQDVALVDRLVAEKLAREAAAIRSEGWKWAEVAPDFPYGHTHGLRQLLGEQVSLTEEEQAMQAALAEEYEALEKRFTGGTEAPEDAEQRFAEIESALNALVERPVRFDAAETAHAGVFISIDATGQLRIERGYVRPEDESTVEPENRPDAGDDLDAPVSMAARADLAAESVDTGSITTDEPEEDDGLRPIPDRLMTELTAHRTLALRRSLGEQPNVAFLAALHALCLKAFYPYAPDSCLDLELRSVAFGAQAPGLKDTELAESFDRRHRNWATNLPKEPGELWDALTGFDGDSQAALFAHCVSLSVNAIFEPYHRRPRPLAHADRLAEALDLDMVAAGWSPTIDTYLGRVTKARILGAVREARGDRAAELLQHLKKGDMAEKAEGLLAGIGWLPEPLRTPGRAIMRPKEEASMDAGPVGEESVPGGQHSAMADSASPTEDPKEMVAPEAVAAE